MGGVHITYYAQTGGGLTFEVDQSSNILRLASNACTRWVLFQTFQTLAGI